MYVITGATGNSGRRIAEALLASGQKVRAIGRGAERLRPLVEQGAEGFVGPIDDVDAMRQAFAGATAVYAMIPPNYTAENFRAFQNRVAKALAKAIAEAGVRHVVSLSSVGAHRAEGVGPITGLHDFEQHLNRLDGVNVLHLRPCYFMENHLFLIDLIKRIGAAGGALREDLVMPMIAIRDISAVAVERLRKLDFSAKSSMELLGQRDLTMQEVARVLGKAIGLDNLSYVRFEYDDYAKGMRDAGFSADAVSTMIEMYRALNDGILRPTEPRTSENTTPTSIEDFAKVFAAVYNQ